MELDENQLSYAAIGALIEVHRELGPGLPESVYQEAVALELRERGVPFEREKLVRVRYKGQLLESFFWLDFVVGGKVVLELKAVDAVLPLHESQLLVYRKLTGLKLGLLVNSNVVKLTDGIYRRALGL